MIKAILEEIGLTHGEIKVYLALLDLGNISIGKIIEKSGISGSKAYEVLDRLIKKGLVSYIIKGKIKYFEATPVERIQDYLEEKEATIKKQKKEIKNILPELKARQYAAEFQGDAIVYKGIKGLKNAYYTSKKEVPKGETVFGMFIPQVNPQLLPFFKGYIEDFSKKQKVKNLLLFNEYSTEIDLIKKIRGVEIQVLPKQFRSPTEIVIHHNNVIIATTGGKEYFTILIKNKEVADSFKQYFMTLWELSKN